MSRYTCEFRFLFDNYNDNALGLADYPIFDEAYRERLNTLIKDTYAFDEIGFETPARFCWYLKNKMRLIMPYYNNIYKAIQEDIDPFVNTRITRTGNSTYQDNEDNDTGRTAKDTEKKSLEHDDKYDGQDVRTVDTDISEQNTISKDRELSRHYEDNTLKDKTTFSGGQEVGEFGTATNTRTGGQTSTRNGSEKTTHSAGNIYEHGLTVDSTTPEGFLKTDTITNDTWASGANKYRKRTEQEKDGTDNKTYSNVQDKTIFDSLKDVQSYENRKTQTKYLPDSENNREVQVKGESGETDTSNDYNLHTGNTGVVDDTVHDTIRKISENAQSTLDKVEQIYTTLEKNGSKEYLDKEEGFRNQTMASMLKEYMEAMKNIDELVLSELSELFICFVN